MATATVRKPRLIALIPAAGAGSRMQAAVPKQYLVLAGRPMLHHVVKTFADAAVIDHVYVVVSADDGWADSTLADLTAVSEGSEGSEGGEGRAARVTLLRCGGASRRDSVLNGLEAIGDQASAEDWMLVHDAARPGLTVAMIESLAGTLRNDPVGGLLALPVVDTLKRADAGGLVEGTVARAGLWAAQTPQMFRHGVLRDALVRNEEVTDEAGAIEAIGLAPRLVAGSPRNFKVTLPHDVALAELYLRDDGAVE